MPKQFLLLGYLLLLLIPAFGQTSPEKTAQPIAEKWLALVDEEKYGDSWTQAASLFKQAVTQPQWESQVQPVRKPLGKPTQRTLKSAQHTQSLPNAPAGEYVVLQYQATYAATGITAFTETVTMVLDTDKTWRTIGYYVRKN